MRKLMGRVLVLVLILAAILLLHGYTGRSSGMETVPDAETDSEAEAVPAVLEQKEVTLGAMRENAELGGVDITVTAPDGTETTYTFTDVEKDSWYADAVNYAVTAGLMNGVADYPLFQPDYGILRESFAVILYRFAGEPTVEAQKEYGDVTQNAWYYDAVEWAASKGLFAGSAANFGVGEYLTCQEAIRVLYRLAGEPETDATLSGYPYAQKVSDSMRAAVAWAWEQGLITEIECVWYPTQTISRAQVALLLMRYDTLIE